MRGFVVVVVDRKMDHNTHTAVQVWVRMKHTSEEVEDDAGIGFVSGAELDRTHTSPADTHTEAAAGTAAVASAFAPYAFASASVVGEDIGPTSENWGSGVGH